MQLLYQVLDQTVKSRRPEVVGISSAEALKVLDRSERFGVWLMDLETGHLFWQKRAFEIFGMAETKDPVNMIEVASKFHPDDLGVRLELLELAAKNKTGFQWILRIQDGHGGYKLIRTVARYKLMDGNKPSLYGIVHHVGPVQFEATTATKSID